MSFTIKFKRGTASEWNNSASPSGVVLALGEPGYEKDTGKLKIGNGITPWGLLPYVGLEPNDEYIQDLLSSFIQSGSGIGVVHDDGLNTLTINVTGLNSSYISDFNEAVDDRVGSGLFISSTGILLSYNDIGNSFTISTTGVSFSGHTHNSSDITNFASSVSGLLPSVSGSGYVNSSFNNNLYTISVTGLQPEGNYSLVGHGHYLTDIYDFNGYGGSLGSGVSGVINGVICVDNYSDLPSPPPNYTSLFLVKNSGQLYYFNPSVSPGYFQTNTTSDLSSWIGGYGSNINNTVETIIAGSYITASRNRTLYCNNLQITSSGVPSPDNSGLLIFSDDTIQTTAWSGTVNTNQINNFGASVSGLLPTVSNSGDNRILTSTGTTTGINGESNLTFDGSLLNVTGSGNFSGSISGTLLNIDNIRIDGNTISSTNINGNIIIQPSGHGPLQRDGGGNSRGQYAVDWQTFRTNNSQVAGGYAASIGGGASNIGVGAYSAINGGVGNIASQSGTSIGGGKNNSASATYATVAGGFSNTASGTYSNAYGDFGHQTIGGGKSNEVTGYFGSIGGGEDNTVSAFINAQYAPPYGHGTIAGGKNNTVNGIYGFIGGGQNNSVAANYNGGPGGSSYGHGTIGGGYANQIYTGAYRATIAGGGENTAERAYSFIGGGVINFTSGDYSVICGGNANLTKYNMSAIVGGANNNTNGYAAFLGGGHSNYCGGSYSVVGGGFSNTVSASYSTIAGGINNTVNDTYSTVGGGNNNIVSGVFSTIGGGSINRVESPYGIVPGGFYAKVKSHGELGHAGGAFSLEGDAQHSIFILRNKTSGSPAGPTELALNGSSIYLTISSGEILSGTANIVGSKSDGSAVARYYRQFTIKNVAGTTALVGSVISIGTDETNGTNITITADDTNDRLAIKASGVNNETWRWVAVVDTVKMMYGL